MPRKRRPLDRTTAVRDAKLIIIATEDTKATVEKIEQISGKKFQRVSDIKEVNYEHEDRIFVATESESHDAWTDMYSNVNFYKWLLKYSIK